MLPGPLAAEGGDRLERLPQGAVRGRRPAVASEGAFSTVSTPRERPLPASSAGWRRSPPARSSGASPPGPSRGEPRTDPRTPRHSRAISEGEQWGVRGIAGEIHPATFCRRDANLRENSACRRLVSISLLGFFESPTPRHSRGPRSRMVPGASSFRAADLNLRLRTYELLGARTIRELGRLLHASKSLFTCHAVANDP